MAPDARKDEIEEALRELSEASEESEQIATKIDAQRADLEEKLEKPLETLREYSA